MAFRRTKNFFRGRPVGPDGQTYRRSALGALGWVLACVLLAIVAAIALPTAGYFAYNYFTYEIPLSKVQVVVAKPDSRCTNPQLPIFVGFVNGSNATISGTSFYLSARLPGHSTDYGDYTQLTSDRIIPAGEGYGQCWRTTFADYRAGAAQVNRDELVWSIRSFGVTFQ